MPHLANTPDGGRLVVELCTGRAGVATIINEEGATVAFYYDLTDPDSIVMMRGGDDDPDAPPSPVRTRLVFHGHTGEYLLRCLWAVKDQMGWSMEMDAPLKGYYPEGREGREWEGPACDG